MQATRGGVCTATHTGPRDEWREKKTTERRRPRKRKEERERERFICHHSRVVYSSGVHISRRLRATTRLFTQRNVSERGSESLSSRVHRADAHQVTHQVCVHRRDRVLRPDVVDDEQSTPVSETTRVIFIINYMASIRATPGEWKVSRNRFD